MEIWLLGGFLAFGSIFGRVLALGRFLVEFWLLGQILAEIWHLGGLLAFGSIFGFWVDFWLLGRFLVESWLLR